MNRGWYGFDLDGTLAYYDGWKGIEHIGEPIRKTANLAKELIKNNHDVRIFTARVSDKSRDIEEITNIIQDWTEKHLGKKLPVTNEKDFDCITIFDDRSVRIIENTGEECCVELMNRMRRAVDVAFEFGGIEGNHNKKWVIDQMLRRLLGDKYDEAVTIYCAGNQCQWDKGIAP